jgi:flagellin
MSGIDLGGASYTAATGASLGTTSAAASALVAVKNAINKLSIDRAAIGAFQARLNYTAEQLTVTKDNLTAADSRLQDVDVAEEAAQYARYNILVQSGTAMLAQANSMPQSVLRLLQ